jgi:hypothetical protein
LKDLENPSAHTQKVLIKMFRLPKKIYPACDTALTAKTWSSTERRQRSSPEQWTTSNYLNSWGMDQRRTSTVYLNSWGMDQRRTSTVYLNSWAWTREEPAQFT